MHFILSFPVRINQVNYLLIFNFNFLIHDAKNSSL